MRTTTALITGLLFMATAVPVVATESVELTIEHTENLEGDTSPQIVGRSEYPEEMDTMIVGHYLWVRYGPTPEDSYEGNVSVDVSDPTVVGAIVSMDGTVTLIRESSNEPDEPETIDLVKEYPNTSTQLPEFEVF